MQTCGNVIAALTETGARVAKVDEIGIGRGVVDRGKELGKSIVGVNVGKRAFDNEEEEDREDEHYFNLRSRLWWYVRTLFENGTIDIDPLDDDLAAELSDIHYERTSNGKIKIESKQDAQRRKVPSPNRADALMLAAADVPGGFDYTKAGMTSEVTW
jgi:hypothetical protein